MTECIACGEDKSDKVDMLAGIEKALEYEGDLGYCLNCH